MERVERVREVRAMGSECAIRVVTATDPDELLDRAVERLAGLERCWSRFLATSELSRLNVASGRPVVVGSDLLAIVRLAIDAWQATEGLFDPTLLDDLIDAGYDSDFDSMSPIAGVGTRSCSPTRLPMVGSITVDPHASIIELPAGVHLDLGGIGKGFAADLLASELLTLGAYGACVDLGGDVRVAGSSIGDDGWGIAVADPFEPDSDLAVVALADGAVATSSRLRRRWVGVDGAAHHLLDPVTGRPADTDLVAVTVVASSAAWAEVHAKAALIGGSVDGLALLVDAGLSALLVTTDHDIVRVGSIGDFLVDGDEPIGIGSNP